MPLTTKDCTSIVDGLKRIYFQKVKGRLCARRLLLLLHWSCLQCMPREQMAPAWSCAANLLCFACCAPTDPAAGGDIQVWPLF